MPDLQNFSITAWARSLAATLPKYAKQLEDEAMRNFKLPALMDANGRILYNQSGSGLTWPVKFRNHDVEGNTGETSRNFIRQNLYVNAALEFRGYQATDSITEKELLENRGDEAVVKLNDRIATSLRESMEQALGTEWYADGYATGNEETWIGMESMFGLNGTIKIDDGTQRSANAADKYGYPSDTYAQLSTELGAKGGSNQSGSIWPNGVAASQYDYWSPLVVNYTSTAFSGTADTWAAQGREALREVNIQCQRNSSLNGQITHCFLARDLYPDFLNQVDTKEQIIVERNGATGLVKLGFTDVIGFDGLEVTWDTGIAATVGYGFNFRNVELLSMYADLLVAEGPHYNENNQTYNSVIKTISVPRFNSPRNFFKLDNLA